MPSPKGGREGRLVKTFQTTGRERIYWFQPSGVWRAVHGVQVFLDGKRRTTVEVSGAEAARPSTIIDDQ